MQKTLPKGWKVAKLGDIADFKRGPFGSSIKKSVCVPKGENTYKVYEQGNIIYNDFIRGEYYITEKQFKDLSDFEFKPNDIAITCAGTLGKIAVAPENLERGIINSVLMRIRINDIKINQKYFIYIFGGNYLQSLISRKSTGVAINNLFATKELKELPIPLPPLPTQHKIVEILEEADNLRKFRQQADEKMKNLIPSLFVQMFGDPVKNPKGWKIVRLGEVAKIISGSTPSTSNPAYWDGDIMWVTPADLSKLDTIEIKGSERKITAEGYQSCSTTMLPAGTVLFSSRAPIGHLAITGKEMCTNQGFKSLIPNEKTNSFYLYFILKHFKERLISLGSGATFKEISKTSVEKFEIPLPPLPLQQEFAKLVEEIEAEKARQAESRKKLDELFQSLMQRAFTGELAA